MPRPLLGPLPSPELVRGNTSGPWHLPPACPGAFVLTKKRTWAGEDAIARWARVIAFLLKKYSGFAMGEHAQRPYDSGQERTGSGVGV